MIFQNHENPFPPTLFLPKFFQKNSHHKTRKEFTEVEKQDRIVQIFMLRGFYWVLLLCNFLFRQKPLKKSCKNLLKTLQNL